MEEYWDIYDANRMFQNRTIRRGDPFQDGEYYVCCEVWFQNSKGEMLITQRHPNKKAGGLWEFTGGGVLAGETTAQATVREVKEEIGVDIKEAELIFLYEHKQRNYFMDIYLVRKDIAPEEIVLDKNETVDFKWVSKDELRAMIENQEVVRSVAERFYMLADKL
ncbi:MAG: NUDIX domain-containing protein [Clostridia bacterium]|nr:NUDIX domain-containing protein [Clostridia bacterium]